MYRSLPVINCEGCGVCCMTFGHPRYFWTQDQGSMIDQYWIDLPQPLVDEIEAYLETLAGDCDADFGKPCIWFDKDRLNCTHHQHRPQVCRDFEIGGESCVRLRRQFGIK